MIPAMGASRSLGLAHGVNLPQVLMSVNGTGALLNLEKGGRRIGPVDNLAFAQEGRQMGRSAL